MFHIKLNKPTFPAMTPAILGLIALLIGPFLVCPCQGTVEGKSSPARFNDGNPNPSPCACCNACPQKATHNHAGTHPRQIKQSAGLIHIPAITLELPIPVAGITAIRPVLPTPGLETLQVFLE